MKTMHLMKHCARLDAAGRACSRRKIMNAVEAMMELHALEQGPVGQLLREYHRPAVKVEELDSIPRLNDAEFARVMRGEEVRT